MELVSTQDVMENLSLGPNGALMYAMEFLLSNVDWLLKRLQNYPDHYFLFDCPGQVRLKYLLTANYSLHSLSQKAHPGINEIPSLAGLPCWSH